MTAPSPIPMRERLRSNYDWTARQREVLNLIARGNTNSEIGAALGISLDGAKWHVSEILSKLQAESREEAADYWRRYNGVAPRFSRVFRGVAGAVATKWVAGAAAVVVAGAATAAIVAIAINQSRDDTNTGNPDTPAPAVTPLPDTGAQPPDPAPNPGGGPTIPGNGTISFNQPVKSIPNSIMYTVTGCFQCDGPDTSLQRHVTDASGALTSTTLLEPDKGILAGWQIGQFVAAPDGSVLAAIVCDGQYCGALGGNKPVANWRLLASTDGGQSWSDALRLQTSYAWIADIGRDAFLLGTHAGGDASSIYRVVSGSGSRDLAPPPGLEQYAQPTLRPGNTVLWLNRSRDGQFLGLVHEDGGGSPVKLPADAVVASDGVTVLADGTIVIASVKPQGGVQLTMFEPGGAVLSITDMGAGYRASLISQQVALTNVTAFDLSGGDAGTNYPVLVDLSKGTATPITSDIFTQQRGRNRFIAFQRQ